MDDMAKWYKKKHPKLDKQKEPVHRSRFDYMTPEKLKFWEEEHN